jgi:hypothetical protein
MLQLLGKGKIAEAVTVVGQEFILAVQVLFRRPEPLTDIRIDSRVSKGDAPIMNIAVIQLDFAAARGQDEVVRSALAVFKKVSLDGIGAIAEAKDKVFVAIVGVILHHVPKHGPVANLDQGFGSILRIPDSQSHSTAK